VTVTDTPAIEIVALRAVPELGEITRVTVAEPTPEDAPETVTQPAKPAIVHGQKAAVWTATVEVPPAAGACSGAGVTK
jgi:hypothetical protein